MRISVSLDECLSQVGRISYSSSYTFTQGSVCFRDEGGACLMGSKQVHLKWQACRIPLPRPYFGVYDFDRLLFSFPLSLLLIPAGALPSMGRHGFPGGHSLYFLISRSSWIGICSSPPCPLPHHAPSLPTMPSCHPLIFLFVSHLTVCTLTTLETTYGWD